MDIFPKTHLLSEWDYNVGTLVVWANSKIGTRLTPEHPHYFLDEIIQFQVVPDRDDGYTIVVLYKVVFTID